MFGRVGLLFFGTLVRGPVESPVVFGSQLDIWCGTPLFFAHCDFCFALYMPPSDTQTHTPEHRAPAYLNTPSPVLTPSRRSIAAAAPGCGSLGPPSGSSKQWPVRAAVLSPALPAPVLAAAAVSSRCTAPSGARARSGPCRSPCIGPSGACARRGPPCHSPCTCPPGARARSGPCRSPCKHSGCGCRRLCVVAVAVAAAVVCGAWCVVRGAVKQCCCRAVACGAWRSVVARTWYRPATHGVVPTQHPGPAPSGGGGGDGWWVWGWGWECECEQGASSSRPRGPGPHSEARFSVWVRYVAHSSYGWTGQQSSSGFCDRPREPLVVFASLDRF
jgi:hypothetical protein